VKLKWWRRVSLAVVALGMTAGPVFADCVNVSRSDKANVQIEAHSPALSPVVCGFAPCTPHLTFDETLLLLFEGAVSFYDPYGLDLCPEGARYLVEQIHLAAALPGSGIDLTWVVGGTALQSGGLENASNPRAQQNLSNGRGIDLFTTNAEISAVIDANLDQANGYCPP
jgi:hypothetical protein